uniref:Acyl-coenzyme A thioesterase 8 n=1 Tax=Romanomermis culicivorax TaxID=13658 RepID=A0A915KQT4_ROMCU
MRSDEDISKVFLDLEKLDRNLFRSRHLLPGLPTTGRVYGGLVIGQSLVSALETVPDEFHVHSLHCYFIKAGDIKMPILYQVDPLRDGGSFCTRSVKAIQDGDAIYVCILSFHKQEAPAIEHQCEIPRVKPPEECRDASNILQDIIKKSDLDDRIKQKCQEKLRALPTTFEMRPVDEKIFLRLQPSAPKLCFWVKAKGIIGDDQRLHHCVAAYISDTGMIGAALLPHPHMFFQPNLTLSLDHAIWFHRFGFAIDDWMLYEAESDVAAGGRTFIKGRLWDKQGNLVVSTAQEGLVRLSRL